MIFMDIHNAIMNTHDLITDIYNCTMGTHNYILHFKLVLSLMDIHDWIMDTHNWIMDVHN